MRTLFPALLLVAAVATPAAAQVELGGGVAAVATPYGAGAFPSLQARVDFTRHFAVETVAAFEPGGFKHGVEGTYLLQVHQAFGASTSKVTPFATYGVLGSFEYRRYPEFRYTLPPTGDTVVYPAYTRRSLSGPFGLTGGVGARVRLTPHAFFEAGAQLLEVDGSFAVAFSGGVTVPIGHGR